MNDEIQNLTISLTTAGMIELEQQNGLDEPDRIEVHPIHLRHMAEKLGLVRELSASDAELRRDLGRYKRALLMLRDRAEQLHKNICGLSQLGHEDMGIEVAQSAALADFAEHVCIEFEDQFEAQTETPPETGTLNTPENGAVQSTQERGDSLFELEA